MSGVSGAVGLITFGRAANLFRRGRAGLPRGNYVALFRRRTCATILGRWSLVFGVAFCAFGCGGKSAGVTSDAGSSDATAIGTDTGQPGSTDGIAPVGDAPAFEDAIDDAQQVQDSTPAVLCDPSKCASGCCGATGCLSGTTSTACGFGGQSCTDCTALGLDCVAPMAGETGGGVCGSLEAGTTADGAPACGPATCAGCCAGSICVAGTTMASCGSHGLACQQCTGTNMTCVAQGAAGACVGTGASCNPSNCSGCCDSNGICQDPTDIGACGTGGMSCQFCLPGQACNSGECQTTSGCGPYNCPGCCQGNTCLSGSLDKAACGSAGAQCQSCSTTCIPLGPKNGGKCFSGSAPDSCGTGCRDIGTAQCMPGNTEAHCNGAGSCIVCGGSCATGVCLPAAPSHAPAPFCGFSNCDGCCMPGGTCWTGGPDDAHCGGFIDDIPAALRGALCIDCGPGYACDTSNSTPFSVCMIACSPQNCQGCCLGGVCSTGTDPTSCGTGGNACAQCALGQVCVSGACVTLSQCGPTLCAGCCQNDICLVGDDNAACGTGGGPCQNCANAGDKCVGATCTP
jgi:hypothetical protein